MFAVIRHPPDVQSSDFDSVGSESKSLEDISSRANAGVEDDCHFCNKGELSVMASETKEGTKRLTVADGFCDLRKHLKRADCSVDLTPGVVSHDDTLAPDFEGFTRVGDVLDTL